MHVLMYIFNEQYDKLRFLQIKKWKKLRNGRNFQGSMRTLLV